jgi:hypothetical protein
MFQRPDIRVSLFCRRLSVGGGRPTERFRPFLIVFPGFVRQIARAAKILHDRIQAAVSSVWPQAADGGRGVCVDGPMNAPLGRCVFDFIDINFFKHPSA